MRDRRGERVVYLFILIDRERGLESGLVLRVEILAWRTRAGFYASTHSIQRARLI